MIKTKFSEPLWRERAAGERIAENTTLGRLGMPEDIAQVALFLASDASGYVNGETIVASGG